MRRWTSLPGSSLLALAFLCVVVTLGYLAAVTYWLVLTPSRTLGFKTDSSFHVTDTDGPESRGQLQNGDTIVAIDGLPPERFSFFKLALTAAPQKTLELKVQPKDRPVHSVSLILRPPQRGWILPLLTLGSLLCALISLILNYRHPAPPEDLRKSVGWVVAGAILPLFLACTLALMSLFASLPLWVFLVLGLPGCLAPLLFFCGMRIGFDTETVAWRNVGLGAAMLFPLPLLIAIHLAHPGKDADPRDLLTDVGMDYLDALGMFLLIAGLFIALCWCFRQKRGYALLPFLTADDKEFNGQAVSKELTAELQRIDNAQRDLRRLYKRYVLGEDDSASSSGRGRIANMQGGQKKPPKGQRLTQHPKFDVIDIGVIERVWIRRREDN
ncbi:MAG: hypothetical protein JWQ49_5386 [Edaphobacter sp.]|nr:hypothetical protein [Edaphobacter sp.]